ncbi:MAG TPA: spore coat protein U domain-containing protein [Candidatus Baltobacteraceae bacterium]|nr:spore coat protein U domain-containing protein [Candidatus Baltobacteraceae bacterium]
MRLTKRSYKRAAVLCAALAAFVSGTTLISTAATAPGTLNVSATVVSNCSLTTTAVAFGNYDPSAALANQTAGAITVTCTKGQVITNIALAGGQNQAGTQRNMKNGGNTLPYSLFQPVLTGGAYTCAGAYTTPTSWGDGSGLGPIFVPTVGTTPGPAPGFSFPVCGQINPGISVPSFATAYTDVVAATLTF